MATSGYETFQAFTDDEEALLYAIMANFSYDDDWSRYFVDAHKMIAKYDWDDIVCHMDDDICEFFRTHIDQGNKINFLILYMYEHKEKFGTDFKL